MNEDGSSVKTAVALAPVETDNLTDRVFEQLRAAITSKTLEPGARLTEVKLAEDLNVSKTPVREALLRLREIGLIEPDGRRGGRVVKQSQAAYAEMHDVREALEVHAAMVAASRAEPAERDAITSAAKESFDGAKAGKRSVFRAGDIRFHEAVARATHNPRLITQIRNCVDLIAIVRERDMPGGGTSVECGQAHLAIAEAIAGEDGALAAELMRAHVRFVRDATLSAMQ